jgi:hypothetical protein
MDGADPFSFRELRARTAGLDGATRLAIFYELPESLQCQAWDHLDEFATHRSQRDFEEVEHAG